MWTASTPVALLLLSFISFDPLSIGNIRRNVVAARVALRCCRMSTWATGFDIIHLLRIRMVPSVSVSPRFAVHLSLICAHQWCRFSFAMHDIHLSRCFTKCFEQPQLRYRTDPVEQNSLRSWEFLIRALTAHEITRVNVSCGT